MARVEPCGSSSAFGNTTKLFSTRRAPTQIFGTVRRRWPEDRPPLRTPVQGSGGAAEGAKIGLSLMARINALQHEFTEAFFLLRAKSLAPSNWSGGAFV